MGKQMPAPLACGWKGPPTLCSLGSVTLAGNGAVCRNQILHPLQSRCDFEASSGDLRFWGDGLA